MRFSPWNAQLHIIWAHTIENTQQEGVHSMVEEKTLNKTQSSRIISLGKRNMGVFPRSL